nr:hypothetical protein [Tanacetum cinerariifolium]
MIVESKDAIFDENRFSLVPRPSLRIPNGTEDISGSVVPKEVTEEEDAKTFDEAIKSHDVTLWKEAINDEKYFIMGGNGYDKKRDKIREKPDKTKHKTESVEKSTVKSQTRQNQSQRNQKVKENKEEGLKLPIYKVV